MCVSQKMKKMKNWIFEKLKRNKVVVYKLYMKSSSFRVFWKQEGFAVW